MSTLRKTTEVRNVKKRKSFGMVITVLGFHGRTTDQILVEKITKHLVKSIKIFLLFPSAPFPAIERNIRDAPRMSTSTHSCIYHDEMLNGRGAFQTPVHPRLKILRPTVSTAPDQPIQAVRGRGGEQNLHISAEADCSPLFDFSICSIFSKTKYKKQSF